MGSIRVKYRPSAVAEKPGTIYYQITHERKMRRLPTDYYVYRAEWNAERSNVVCSGIGGRSVLMLKLRDLIARDIERIQRVIRKVERELGDYTVDDILYAYNAYVAKFSMFNYMKSLIAKLRELGRVRTSETYSSTLMNFSKFREGRDIILDSITPEVMEKYEAWQKMRGISANTISFYNRILRAVYNRAADEGGFDNCRPFRKVYTGIDKTVKRALPIKMLRKIRKMDLSGDPEMDYARDMFLMSFYLRGMSFVDMAFLEKSDLMSGYVVYRRRKTGQMMKIAWTSEMDKILMKYPANESRYLLPIIKDVTNHERSVFRNKAYYINRCLKRIGEALNFEIPLTLYVARHSWASVARTKGVPLSIISEGMGHTNEATTRIYLASLDTSDIDRANALIIKSI